MKPIQTMKAYYRYANAGDWDKWCDLFTERMVMDEQLAGRVQTRATLRQMMGGMKKMYRAFKNRPLHMFVSGKEGAVVSHISAVSPKGAKIEADVMNYFRFAKDGRIAYMANFHDSKPFKPVLGG